MSIEQYTINIGNENDKLASKITIFNELIDLDPSSMSFT